MSLEEKLKSLEGAHDYSEMVNELRKAESALTHWYAKLGSLLTEDHPQLAGMLQSVEEISQTTTTILRRCSMLLDESFASVPAEIQASTTISTQSQEQPSRDRDDVFSLTSLTSILQELPTKTELSNTEVMVKFWFIIEGKNESVELNIPENEYFISIIIKVLNQIENLTQNEEFSVSPLGFNPLLLPQFENSVSQIVNSYSNEFTLIKFYR
ncbi:MAG: hypothetical protein ACXACP_11620 [Candidatus Hodarchaeales archaeon]|jgi:hypothetical protein